MQSRDIVNLAHVIDAAVLRSQARGDSPKITEWLKAKLSKWLATEATCLQRLLAAEDYWHFMDSEPPEWFLQKLAHNQEVFYAPVEASEILQTEIKAVEVLQAHWREYDQKIAKVTLRHLLDRWQKDDEDEALFKPFTHPPATQRAVEVIGSFGSYTLFEFVSTHKSRSVCWHLRRALADETATMKHCVGRFQHSLRGGYAEHYARAVETGAQRIFSIREGGESIATMSCRYSGLNLYFDQIKSVKNALPKDSLRKILCKVSQHLNIVISGTGDAIHLGLTFHDGKAMRIEDVTDRDVLKAHLKKHSRDIRFFKEADDELQATALQHSEAALAFIKNRGPLVTLNLMLQKHQETLEQAPTTKYQIGHGENSFDLLAWLHAPELPVRYRFHHTLIQQETAALPWERIAWSLQSQKDREYDSLVCFKKALSLDGSRADLWNTAGDLAFRKLDMVDLAKEYFQKALELSPEHHQAAHNLGDACLRYNRCVDEAMAAYKMASIQPCNVVLFQVARTLQLQGKGSKDYLPWLKKAAEANNTWHMFYKAYGLYWEEQKEIDKAKEWYRRVFETFSEDTWTLCKLIELDWYEEQHLAAHVDILKKLVKERPRFVWASGRLALALSGQKKFTEAKQVLKEALALTPKEPWLLALTDPILSEAPWSETASSVATSEPLISAEDMLYWHYDQYLAGWLVEQHPTYLQSLLPRIRSLRLRLPNISSWDLFGTYSELLKLARKEMQMESKGLTAYVWLAMQLGTTEVAEFYKAIDASPNEVPL